MSILQEIQSPIKDEIGSFEKKFRATMKTNVVLLDKIMTYIVKRKGKQMRPMFVFLMAKLVSDTNDSTYRAATLIELLHTASLVHDDVVDDSAKRRGFFSVNALWKNKIAVLVGDFLLSKGLLLSVEYKDYHLLEIVSNAVKEMSEGELLQIEKARRLDITQEVYFDIIRQKTASLLASCCAAGIASTSDDKELIEKGRLLGEKIGIAFQIKDDLFDYGDSEIGKPRGIDIKEKKMTLPLIHALNNSERRIKRKIINTIKNDSEDSKKVKEVIEFVKSSGGIEHTIEVMKTYHKDALTILNSFPDNEARKSLEKLINYTIERKK